jgi:hypothetical protein
MDSIQSVDITPDFDALYRRFKGELEAEAQRLAQEGTTAELGAVRGLLVPLAILATSLAKADMVKDFQAVVAEASRQVAEAHDAKVAAQDEETPGNPGEDLFCPICLGHEAYAYTGVDGKPHVQCPRCGIIA